jgi:chromosome segregation ATPase
MDEETKAAFAELRQLFTGMQHENRQQFQRMDDRFERIDGQFQQIDGQFQQIDGRFQQIDGRFQRIDGQLQRIDGQLPQIDGQLQQIDDRFARMDRKIDEQHAETRHHMGVLVENLEHKIAALVEGFEFMNEKVGRNKAECEATTAALDVRVTRLEATNTRRR